MKKIARFLILSIIILVLILTSIQETASPGGFVESSNSSIAAPLVAQQKSDRMRGLVFVEFFAGQ
jgi:hypothetical protein